METTMKKRMILLLTGALLLTAPVFAQNPGPRKDLTKEQRAENASQRMKTQLGLTDEQTRKVYDVMLQREEQLVNNRDAMRQRREEMDKQLSQILTPEQFDKFQQNRQERREQSKGRRRGYQAPPPSKLEQPAPATPDKK
jgi:Spy/CpxP family protein refolding chaperone